MSIYDLIIIGGGAAGFFGALACAEAHPGARILILERGNALLAKVKVSGGGRCNVTHAQFDPARLAENYPRGGQALRGPFTRFQPRDTIAWFERRGVALKREPDGRVFPASDRSQTIIDCFLAAGAQAGIEIRTRCPVDGIARAEDEFVIRIGDERLAARTVLLATGGERGGFALASGLGHTIVPPVPSLFTFVIDDPRLNGLPGVAVADVRLALTAGGRKFEQRGPLLITHWGVSGPAVLRLSAWAARALAESGYQARLRITWQPEYSADALQQRFLERKKQSPRQAVSGQDPAGGLPVRLWKQLVRVSGILEEQAWGETSNAALVRLSEEIQLGEYTVKGKGAFKDEFVTCGGVSLKEVDFKRMQSRIAPGLFFAGEVLDIDGITGGFNFQAAWTTGWIAGNAAAESLPGSG